MPNDPKQPTPSPDLDTYRLERAEGEAEYSAKDLQHLSDLEHVRERPSMYIADTTARGLHHLVYEVVDNSIDEAMAGFATRDLGDDQQRRLGHRRGQRPRHPRRDASRPGLLHAPGRDDRAEVRRQVRQGGLPDLRRPARRRRHRGQFPLRMVRGRSPPRRPRLPAGIRAGRAGGRRPPHRPQRSRAAPRPPSSPTRRSSPTPSSSTTSSTAACRSWPSSIAA